MQFLCRFLLVLVALYNVLRASIGTRGILGLAG